MVNKSSCALSPNQLPHLNSILFIEHLHVKASTLQRGVLILPRVAIVQQSHVSVMLKNKQGTGTSKKCNSKIQAWVFFVFWMSQRVACSPARWILFHVTFSCKWLFGIWLILCAWSNITNTISRKVISVVQTSGKEIVHVHFLFKGYQPGNLGDWMVPWGTFILPPHTAAN